MALINDENYLPLLPGFLKNLSEVSRLSLSHGNVSPITRLAAAISYLLPVGYHYFILNYSFSSTRKLTLY